MSEFICPNCNKSVQEKELFPSDAVELINKYTSGNSTGYCVRCSKNSYLDSLDKLNKEKGSWNKYFIKNMFKIPALTLQQPLNWNYDAIGIVSGQCTMGIGLSGFLSSTFADLTGGQSSDFNQKIMSAENMSIDIARLNTLNMGGNAIIGMTINYSEAGGKSDLLMVTAVGTAIKLKNLDVLGETKKKDIEEIMTKSAEFIPLLKYKTYKV